MLPWGEGGKMTQPEHDGWRRIAALLLSAGLLCSLVVYSDRGQAYLSENTILTEDKLLMDSHAVSITPDLSKVLGGSKLQLTGSQVDRMVAQATSHLRALNSKAVHASSQSQTVSSLYIPDYYFWSADDQRKSEEIYV